MLVHASCKLFHSLSLSRYMRAYLCELIMINNAQTVDALLSREKMENAITRLRWLGKQDSLKTDCTMEKHRDKMASN